MGQVYKFCKKLGKVVPIEQAHEIEAREKKAISAFTTDEMAPTKHPINGYYYTSKSKFREVTRAAGYDEVGDEYERGYDPEIAREKESQERIAKVGEEFRERMKNG